MWVAGDEGGPGGRSARTTRLRHVLDDLVRLYLPGPEVASVDRTCGRCGRQHGKPQVVVGGRPSPLRVSVAHSGGAALFAFAASTEVGVDVEEVRPDFDWSPVLHDVFSEAERRQTEATEPDPASRRRRYYERWVAKEAVLKAMGTGLDGPVKEVDTTGGPHTTWRGWAVQPLPLDPPLVGALACAERPAVVRLLTVPT